jgi:hypothetical protein
VDEVTKWVLLAFAAHISTDADFILGASGLTNSGKNGAIWGLLLGFGVYI